MVRAGKPNGLPLTASFVDPTETRFLSLRYWLFNLSVLQMMLWVDSAFNITEQQTENEPDQAPIPDQCELDQGISNSTQMNELVTENLKTKSLENK